MVRSRRPVKDARKRVLREAEDLVTGRDSDYHSDNLTRIGVVWAGLLDLDDAIPATTVAAMLSSRDLVYATSTVDSEEHWIGAAAHAALGAYSEGGLFSVEAEEAEEPTATTTATSRIGFTSSNE
jgi:hypothetical protein